MNFMNKLISPSVTRSIVYPILAAGCIYVGANMLPSKEYSLLVDKSQEAINSNSNLVRVLTLDHHIKNSRVADSINDQLKAEREELLNQPETKMGYDLIEKRRYVDGLRVARSVFAGIGIGLFALLGFNTIQNTLVDRRGKKKLTK